MFVTVVCKCFLFQELMNVKSMIEQCFMMLINGQCDSAVSDFQRCERCENLCHHDGPTKCSRSLTMHRDRCEDYRFMTYRWCDSCDEEMPDEDNESSQISPHVCARQRRNNDRAHILVLAFLMILITVKKYGVE